VPPTRLPTSAHATFEVPLADREGALALALLPGVGPRTWRTLMTAHDGDAERAAASHRRGTPSGWAAARREAGALLAAAATGPYALHLPGDPLYPPALLDLPDAPVTVWTAGDARLLARAPLVAVVGTAGQHGPGRANHTPHRRSARRVRRRGRERHGARDRHRRARGRPRRRCAHGRGARHGVDVPYPRQKGASTSASARRA
jgi:hypothetical protein